MEMWSMSSLRPSEDENRVSMSFLRIAITSPEPLDDENAAREIDIILKLLKEKEVDIVHLRKPSSPDYLRYLSHRLSILCDGDLRSRLAVHDFFDVAEDYGLGGIHLNSNHPVPPRGWQGRVSRSLHSVDEMHLIEDEISSGRQRYDYITLSPIYDSISKAGYHSNFDINLLTPLLAKSLVPVIALGGVTPEKFPELKEAGFAGAAMLGYYFGKKLNMS